MRWKKMGQAEMSAWNCPMARKPRLDAPGGDYHVMLHQSIQNVTKHAHSIHKYNNAGLSFHAARYRLARLLERAWKRLNQRLASAVFC
jgi:hypothetical protein